MRVSNCTKTVAISKSTVAICVPGPIVSVYQSGSSNSSDKATNNIRAPTTESAKPLAEHRPGTVVNCTLGQDLTAQVNSNSGNSNFSNTSTQDDSNDTSQFSDSDTAVYSTKDAIPSRDRKTGTDFGYVLHLLLQFLLTIHLLSTVFTKFYV